MSRKGNCWNNAVAESFFNNLKNERVHGRRYATRDKSRADVFDSMDDELDRIATNRFTLQVCSHHCLTQVLDR
jgi:transposase InsO family protein